MLNVTCPQAALHEALQIVSRGVTGRSTQPVQNNIYLESAADHLRLVATDLEYISIEANVPVTVADEGAVTAPARLLTELAASLPHGDVNLAVDEQQALAIACGQANYTIRGLAAADYQMFPPIGDSLRVSFPQSQLSGILRQTAFATSRDETRPILTGALFEFKPGEMQVVATDTYRLAVRKAQIDLELEAPVSSIVSARALNELLRVLSAETDDPVTLAVSENQAELDVGGIKIASRLIEGQFPNYEKVIPDSHARRLTVGIAPLEEALRRALIVAREDANRVVLRSEGDKLELTAESHLWS